MKYRYATFRPFRGRTRAFNPIPSEMDFGVTATVVVDEPREPKIIPTGVLDHRGDMLLKVIVPIKSKLGFDIKAKPVLEEVCQIVPESMLAVYEDMPGLALSHFTPEDVVEGFIEEDDDEAG